MTVNTLTRKSHIEMITLKLSVACLVVTAIKPFVTLEMVHHSYFHSITNYRIIFWANSSYSDICSIYI